VGLPSRAPGVSHQTPEGSCLFDTTNTENNSLHYTSNNNNIEHNHKTCSTVAALPLNSQHCWQQDAFHWTSSCLLLELGSYAHEQRTWYIDTATPSKKYILRSGS